MLHRNILVLGSQDPQGAMTMRFLAGEWIAPSKRTLGAPMNPTRVYAGKREHEVKKEVKILSMACPSARPRPGNAAGDPRGECSGGR